MIVHAGGRGGAVKEDGLRVVDADRVRGRLFCLPSGVRDHHLVWIGKRDRGRTHIVGNDLRSNNASVKAGLVDVGIFVRNTWPTEFSAGDTVCKAVMLANLSV